MGSNKRGAGALLKIVLVMTLGTLSFLLHTWLRTSIVTQSFEMGQLRKELSRAENDLMVLQSQRENEMNSVRLMKLLDRWSAEGDVFVAAKSNQIIFLNEPQNEDSK